MSGLKGCGQGPSNQLNRLLSGALKRCHCHVTEATSSMPRARAPVRTGSSQSLSSSSPRRPPLHTRTTVRTTLPGDVSTLRADLEGRPADRPMASPRRPQTRHFLVPRRKSAGLESAQLVFMASSQYIESHSHVVCHAFSPFFIH